VLSPPLWTLITPLAEVALILSGKRREPSESEIEHKMAVLRSAFRDGVGNGTEDLTP
jgi:hypothetical protein